MAETELTSSRDSDSPEPAVDAGTEQLRKRARRRLVGAVALALLAAIVLPMVMDQEPKPAVQDIQIRIPSQDQGTFTSRLLPAKPAATPLPPVQPQPPVPAAPVTAPAAAAAPSEPKPEPAKAAEKPAETAAVAKKADEARAKALLDGDKTAWVLQLGAYQDQGNVKVLVAKVKELGYPSYTEKVSTPQGPRIRVRAGPFASREAAEKAQSRLKKIGAGGPAGGVVTQK